MCAAAWEGITRNLAQKIAGKNRGEHLKRRHWQTFATECGLSAPRLIKRIGELANIVLREVRVAAAEVNAMPAGTHALMPAFVEAIEVRARAIISGLSEDGPKPAAQEPRSSEASGKKPRKKKAKMVTR
jgi:serine/threonine-protein kinase HipA